MSSIRLQGTSSGYYDLTVPAAAGTNSIDLSNLPVKDSNGNLSVIGDIIRNDTTLGTMKFALQYNGADAAVFRRNNTTGVATISNGYAGSAVDSLNIDLAGRITTPNQPYFFAYATAQGVSISNGIMPYDQTSTNVGNHFNTSNYTFTAPIGGRYLFTVSALNYPNTTAGGELYFSINGGGYTALARFNQITSQQSITGSAIFNLSANDTVRIMGTLHFYAHGGHGHFSGILIG